MRDVEARLHALVEKHCDTSRYTTRRPVLELLLIAFQALVGAALVGTTIFCLSFSSAEVGSRRWIAAYGLLWLVAQYSVWLPFMTMHEWRHNLTSSPWMQRLYLAVGWLGSAIAPAESLPYYVLGHLDHHQHNGQHSLYQYLLEPWWAGKDADVLFFGFSLRNPFHSDDFPLTPLIGPIAYLLYSGPGLVTVYTVLTVGEMLNFGASTDQMIVLSLQAAKAAVMTYAYQHHTVHFFMYFIAFSVLNLHFSLIALYIPLTHPERNARVTGLKRDLETRFKQHYPTYTPPFPTWVHQWIFLGMTLHIEHHSFPQTPWYNLPLVHRDMLMVASNTTRHPEPTVATDEELRNRIQLATPSRVISERELAQHGSKESCWMAISGVVYDLTEWHGKHPGGAKIILAMSGRDATASYTKQHTSLSNVAANLDCGISIFGLLESVEEPHGKRE